MESWQTHGANYLLLYPGLGGSVGKAGAERRDGSRVLAAVIYVDWDRHQVKIAIGAPKLGRDYCYPVASQTTQYRFGAANENSFA